MFIALLNAITANYIKCELGYDNCVMGGQL